MSNKAIIIAALAVGGYVLYQQYLQQQVKLTSLNQQQREEQRISDMVASGNLDPRKLPDITKIPRVTIQPVPLKTYNI